MLKLKPKYFRRAGSVAVALAAMAQSQTLTYKGCPDLQASDFRKTTVADFIGSGRTKFNIAQDGRIVAAGGSAQVSVFDPKTGTQIDAGKPDSIGSYIWGVAGMAIDPAFTTNGRIYIFSYKPLAGDSQIAQIRRYTLKNNVMDPASERLILEWGTQRTNMDHSGGGMGFDAAGNMYLGVGENAWFSGNYGNINETDPTFNALRSAANTNDLRGKILRIKPKPFSEEDPAPAPGVGTTYDIPAGNLFPPGTALTRPEIYVMGCRNPFSLNIDPATGWVLWGEVGPNATVPSADKGPAGREEFNLFPQAGNAGWPMFTGPNLPYLKYDYVAKKTGPAFDSLAPVNDSKLNTGMQTLPRPRGSLVAYTRDVNAPAPWPGFTTGSEIVPVAGPIYRYDGSQTATYRLPPHFDGLWFITDYYMKWIKAVAIDAKGEKAVDVQPVFAGLTYSSVTDMKIGPDGGLYVLENSSQLVSRIEYTGTCLPKTANSIQDRSGVGRAGKLPGLTVGNRLVEVPAEFSGFTLFDQGGRRIWSYVRRGAAPAMAQLPAGLENQVLLVRWEALHSR
ncbi:MAG: PQQ-dependent sugar dehydrogenase [Fibrobacteria bacterium]